ncbi:hypothetical protein SGGMMB4_01136 [Sodalis glossinidius str. 'morsitans']|uniref:Uncharacterized protein n=1 Tax=Sodalis glossinidius (strain morsitans) TaxID=343509 RepID=A0A193QG98_SODGM|nr:hypothetical protein [Sodalis glossinidius]CRL44186.1 hypothetical protein SGGMMB4_01136 [Sodalis glossinidius str. 'morsitans']
MPITSYAELDNQFQCVKKMLSLKVNLDADDHRIIQKILHVGNSAERWRVPPPTIRPKCSCRSLANDFVKIKNLHSAILAAPAEIAPQLLAAFGQTLCSIPYQTAPLLVVSIAQARVKMAEGCHKVAKEHGITDELVQCGLELSAVMGPSVKGVADGQTCKTIADALEILHSAPRLALEMLTVKGPAVDCRRKRGRAKR